MNKLIQLFLTASVLFSLNEADEYDLIGNKGFECYHGDKSQLCLNPYPMHKSIILYSLQQAQKDKQSFAVEILQGLKKKQKQIPMKFIYDQEGSKICSDIQQSPQYYIWECEKDLIQNQGHKLLKLFGQNKFNLIDLGAGDGTKTRILLKIAQKEGLSIRYIPLDISYYSNIQLLENIGKQFPSLEVTALTANFQQGITWIQSNMKQKNVYLFLGTTISNSKDQENQAFCRYLSKQLKKGDIFVIGFDIWKNPETIARAYFDNGYESKFIMNVLNRINRQLNSNFNLQKFYGYPYFDPYDRVVKANLISAEEQQVYIGEQVIKFEKGEVVNVIRSKKWFIEEMVSLFQLANMQKIAILQDQKQYIAYIVFEKL